MGVASHKSRRGALRIVRGAACQRHENRHVEGVEWVWFGEGVSRSPVWEGSGDGAVPLPRIFFTFFPFEITRFDAFCNTFYSSDGV